MSSPCSAYQSDQSNQTCSPCQPIKSETKLAVAGFSRAFSRLALVACSLRDLIGQLRSLHWLQFYWYWFNFLELHNSLHWTANMFLKFPLYRVLFIYCSTFQYLSPCSWPILIGSSMTACATIPPALKRGSSGSSIYFTCVCLAGAARPEYKGPEELVTKRKTLSNIALKYFIPEYSPGVNFNRIPVNTVRFSYFLVACCLYSWLGSGLPKSGAYQRQDNFQLNDHNIT